MVKVGYREGYFSVFDVVNDSDWCVLSYIVISVDIFRYYKCIVWCFYFIVV